MLPSLASKEGLKHACDMPSTCMQKQHACAVFYALRDARRAGADAQAARLDAELRRLTAAAGALEEANAFGALLQRAGAVGLNATTSHDATKCGPLGLCMGTLPHGPGCVQVALIYCAEDARLSFVR